jgi:glycerol kinase
MADAQYVMAIDSGSTGIRAVLFDKKGQIVAREYEKTPATYPSPGAIEHDPLMLWNTLLQVVKNVISSKQVDPKSISSIGITNQRGSFCLWERETGKPLINFVNWADVRAAETCDRMNKNSKWRLIRKVAGIVSALTNNPMMTATKMLNLTTDHASTRLRWVLDQHPDLEERCKKGEVMFGTIDTWFIYKLTNHKHHLTDYTNAAATSMYNPFQLIWNKIVCDLFGLPMNIFPEVRDSNGDFGSTDKTLFGVEIPIRGVAGDQQAALFGHCCFEPGDVKISQGSGAFVDMNVGEKPMVSKRGLFPMIAWSVNGKLNYMLEGYVATAGTLIDWLGQGIGVSDTPIVLNEFAAQCADTEGVLFMPMNSGVRYPYFNPRARGSILGLSLSTHRRHVARAVLEGIALRLHDILAGMETDTRVSIKSIKVDGGVSRSDILLQCVADFANISVNRAPESDMTATGAAYLAGLGSGFWKDQAELRSLQTNYTQFTPKMDATKRDQKIAQWTKALSAILKIY